MEVGIAGKIDRPFLALLPSFTNRGLSCRLTWSASGTKWRCTEGGSPETATPVYHLPSYGIYCMANFWCLKFCGNSYMCGKFVDQNPRIRVLQWRTQEFFSRGGSTNSVEDRGQRERGSRGSSPLVRGSAQFAILFDFVKLSGCRGLLRMYFPWNCEFGSALSKLRNFGGGLNTPNPTLFNMAYANPSKKKYSICQKL
jgi:hypothetical protein